MRISDWSSDVCSSDLPAAALLVRFLNSPMEPILSYGCTKHSKRWSGPIFHRAKRVPRSQAPDRENRKKSGRRRTPQISAMRNSQKRAQAVRGGRWEGRRVGKDGVSTSRSGWSSDKSNKKWKGKER